MLEIIKKILNEANKDLTELLTFEGLCKDIIKLVFLGCFGVVCANISIQKIERVVITVILFRTLFYLIRRFCMKCFNLIDVSYEKIINNRQKANPLSKELKTICYIAIAIYSVGIQILFTAILLYTNIGLLEIIAVVITMDCVNYLVVYNLLFEVLFKNSSIFFK